MRLRYSGLAILGCVILFCAYLQGRYSYVIEVFPCIKWMCSPSGRSRLIDDELGVIAEGSLDLTICDYGLCVYQTGRTKPVYVDLIEHRVVALCEAGTNLWDKSGVVFSIDAPSAAGVYSKYGRVEFERAISNLVKRVDAAKAARRQKGKRSDVSHNE